MRCRKEALIYAVLPCVRVTADDRSAVEIKLQPNIFRVELSKFALLRKHQYKGKDSGKRGRYILAVLTLPRNAGTPGFFGVSAGACVEMRIAFRINQRKRETQGIYRSCRGFGVWCTGFGCQGGFYFGRRRGGRAESFPNSSRQFSGFSGIHSRTLSAPPHFLLCARIKKRRLQSIRPFLGACFTLIVFQETGDSHPEHTLPFSRGCAPSLFFAFSFFFFCSAFSLGTEN